MKLLGSTFLTLISTSFKMLTALILNKIIALYVGPSGLALIAQFQNFIQISSTIGQGAIATGLTKYTAQFATKQKQLNRLIKSALAIAAVCSVITSLLIFLFASTLSTYLFSVPEYRHIFWVLSLSIPLFALNSLLLAIVNGFKKIKEWVVINIIQSLVSLLLMLPFIIFLGLEGAFLSLALIQVFVLFVTIIIISRKKLIVFRDIVPLFSSEETILLLRFSLMGVVGMISGPTAILIIRACITNIIGLNEAGYWQAVYSISTMYLTVITTSIMVYYLPRISELQYFSEIRREVFSALLIGMSFAVILAVGVYFLRNVIVQILFTKDFLTVGNLLFWQLIGDVIRVTAWIFAYVFVAKAMILTHLLLETAGTISLIGFSYVFIDKVGLEGAPIAYAVSNFIYLVAVVWTFNHTIIRKLDRIS